MISSELMMRANGAWLLGRRVRPNKDIVVGTGHRHNVHCIRPQAKTIRRPHGSRLTGSTRFFAGAPANPDQQHAASRLGQCASTVVT